MSNDLDELRRFIEAEFEAHYQRDAAKHPPGWSAIKPRSRDCEDLRDYNFGPLRRALIELANENGLWLHENGFLDYRGRRCSYNPDDLYETADGNIVYIHDADGVIHGEYVKSPASLTVS